MSKIAVPIWQNRVSPVLDSARSVLVVDLDGGKIVSQETVYLPATSLGERVEIIADQRIDTVLCGALSRTLNDLLTRAGITVYAWITGELDDVLGAYWRGDLNNDRFLLPGCRRRRRKHGHRWGDGRRRRHSQLNFSKED